MVTIFKSILANFNLVFVKRKLLVFLTLVGVVALSCFDDPLQHSPQNETDTPAPALKSGPSDTYYMNAQGLIRNPDGSGGEYIDYPYLNITEEENTASLKKYSINFNVPDGSAFNDDSTVITNYTKIMDNLMGPEIELEPEQVSFTYGSTLMETVVPEEFFNTIDEIEVPTSPFSGGTKKISLSENMSNFEDNPNIEMIAGEDEITVVQEMEGIYTGSGNTLKAYITFDIKTNRPLEAEIKDGEELVMSFEFSNQYSDPRDVTISTFMDNLEILRTTFSNTK